MIQTLEAIIDERGYIQLSEPVRLPSPRRALVTILEEAPIVDASNISDPPISIRWRPSKLTGLVLQVANTTSDKHLSCKMTVHSQVKKADGSCRFNVPPNGTKDIGILQAEWTFKTGETGQIETEGHRPLRFTVP